MSAQLAAAPATNTGAANAAPPYLVVDQVSKHFGTTIALERASLTVAAGEFVCFLGPSGCGKTTLLRAIAGLDPATSGRILQDGRDITFLPPAARDFGIVFQSYALFPNLSVNENVGYGLRGRAWPAARRTHRVAELLSLVGLSEHSQKYPAQLSGGQQQRVALARALAAEPGLLLLDEPLSALDAQVRLHLRQELRALQRRLGVTTVMVTHDQEEAMGVSDRIVVMSRGHIEQIGTPETIYRQPASAFVAGFVGHASRFDAVVDAPPGTLLADGLTLPCLGARRMLYGAPVQAFIRPEDVAIGPSATALEGNFAARVMHQEFLGPICRVTLQVGRLQLEADVNPAVAPAIGEVLLAALPAERLMVFPRNV
jgi:iron(III) transport system ATP-binding protein